jgi:hypothetical protein
MQKLKLRPLPDSVRGMLFNLGEAFREETDCLFFFKIIHGGRSLLISAYLSAARKPSPSSVLSTEFTISCEHVAYPRH